MIRSEQLYEEFLPEKLPGRLLLPATAKLGNLVIGYAQIQIAGIFNSRGIKFADVAQPQNLSLQPFNQSQKLAEQENPRFRKLRSSSNMETGLAQVVGIISFKKICIAGSVAQENRQDKTQARWYQSLEIGFAQMKFVEMFNLNETSLVESAEHQNQPLQHLENMVFGKAQ